ncbi:DEAD/DEAH box helicase family protein [Streptomyces goshikiensis]|uniref:DEAD/DEAH box helicase family protein n=1 Tax=Streptomyces goshikiensis TaxID=1942 RepID=UPI0036C36555
MATRELRPHQHEAVDAVLHALELTASRSIPERGLRTQVVMATGSGKTLVATRSAQALRAGRVLVLVPSLDLGSLSTHWRRTTNGSWRSWRGAGRRWTAGSSRRPLV